MTARTLSGSSGGLLADRRLAYAERALDEGDAAAAADVARQTLDLAPDWVPAWLLLGAAEERLGRPDAARAAYARGAEHDAGGRFGAALHVARLSGQPPPGGMPDAYVATLFDQYASRFDRHLVDGLGYRAPALLASALSRTAGGGRFARALDLGCGTGLMGVAIRDRVDRLEGVDLSPAMVAVAGRKAVYDALHVGEGARHLRTAPPGTFDLILAADVLVYLGPLGPAFEAAAQALTTGGLLAFTAQTHAGEGIRLGDDLRYAHAPGAVRDGLADAGLALLRLEAASTRREKGVDVPGLVAVARKP